MDTGILGVYSALKKKEEEEERNRSALNLLNNASSSKSYTQVAPTETAGEQAAGRAAQKKKETEFYNYADTIKRIDNANKAMVGAFELQGNTIDAYAKDLMNIGANVNYKVQTAIDNMPINQIEKSADSIYKYAKGERDLASQLNFARLKNSYVGQNVPDVSSLVAEIESGTFKGTADDIRSRIAQGRIQQNVNLYNEQTLPWNQAAAEQNKKLTDLYGSSGWDPGTVAKNTANIGANLTAFLGLHGAGASVPLTGAAMGLSSDSSQIAKQIEEGNLTLDQATRDFGVDAGLGALFGLILQGSSSAINAGAKALIPAGVDIMPAVVAARNTLAGAGGGYIANGATGTLRNLYNLSQGRNVSEEDLAHPWWSEDALKATLVSALFSGISGTKSDLAKANNIKNVMAHRGELNQKLDGYIKDALSGGDAMQNYGNGVGAIENFFANNNLGQSTQLLRESMLAQWEEAFAEYTGTTPTSNVNTQGLYAPGLNAPQQGLNAPKSSSVIPQNEDTFWNITNMLKDKPATISGGETGTAQTSSVAILPNSTTTSEQPTAPTTQAKTPSAPAANETKPSYTSTSGKVVNYATSKEDYSTEPEEGKIRLYTNTPFENIDSILENGISHTAGKNRAVKEYEGDAIWFETTPDLQGYGGTTIAVDVKPNKNFDKVNNTQYMVYEDIKPEDIKFIDRPLFDNIRTSDLPALIEQFGVEHVKDVVHKGGLGMDKYVTDKEFDNIIGMLAGTPQTIDTAAQQAYNNTENNYSEIGGTSEDEFGRLQEESRTMSTRDTEMYHTGEKQVDGGLRKKLSDVLGGELRTKSSSSGYGNASFVNTTTGEKTDFYTDVDAETFSNDIKIVQKYLRNGDAVDAHDATSYKDTKNYLTKDGLGGFAITKDGDLISVFNLGKTGFLKTISDTVKKNAKTLDCFQSERQPLADIYEKALGFKKAAIMDYSYDFMVADRGKEYADYFVKTYGKAPVVFMVNTDEPVPIKHFNEDQYDEAQAYQQSFVKKKKDSTSKEGVVSEPKTKYGKNSEQGSFSMPKNKPRYEPYYVFKTARKFLKDFEEVGYIDINGAKIDNAVDLADECQIFRDPLVETKRYIFLNDDNIVVGQTALTSHRVNTVHFGILELTSKELLKTAKKLGATKIWGMHNHPSTNIRPSEEDISSSNKLGSLLKGHAEYMGEIIIDHNEFTYIAPEGDIKQNIPLSKPTVNRIEDYFSDDGWTKMHITSKEAVASLATLVTNRKGFSSLMLLNQHKYPMLLQELPNKFFMENSSKKTEKYLRDLAQRNGAASAAIATTSPETYKAIKEKKLPVLDVVQYKSYDTGDLDIIRSMRADRSLKKKELFSSWRAPYELLSNEPEDKYSTEEKLEEAINSLRDELAKKERQIERLKKKRKAKRAEQTKRRRLRLAKKEMKAAEERRFKSAKPKTKLKILGKRIEKQAGYYEVNNFPQLDEFYEKEFGKTIRQTLKTLHTNDVFPYLPQPIQDIVSNYVDETYLKANWKTFDKYLREALEVEKIKNLLETSDTPLSNKLLKKIKDHEAAPILIKNAREMYDDLQILSDIVELAQERMAFKRENGEIQKILTDVRPELERIAKQNKPKKETSANARINGVLDKFESARELPEYLSTRIQALMDGNPNSELSKIWDWFKEGNEKSMELDVAFARNFDDFVVKAPGGWKYKGELEKDFNKNAKPIDTGITGSKPNGEKYTDTAKLTKPIIMHIVASSKNQDNLMGFSKVLLGEDEDGNPVYSEPGGYIVPNEYWMKRGNFDKAYEEGKKYIFSKKEIDQLEDLLTPLEKDFVEACLNVGKITAKYGNEVSQKLIGRDIFTVDNYVRIKRDINTFDEELIDPSKLDNLANAMSEQYIGIEGTMGRGGSLEARNHRSRRAIYGEDLLQSVTKSFNGAKKYISYAIPLYDTDMLLKSRYQDTFEKVKTVDEEPKSKSSLGINYAKVEELPRHASERTYYVIDNGNGYDIYKRKEEGKTLRQLITATGDKGFLDFYNKFVDRIVGRAQKYSKFASMRAKVVLNANLSVAATQFFSFFQIGQFMNHSKSSMLKGLLNKKSIYDLSKEYLEKNGKDIKGLKGQQVVNKLIEEVTFLNTFRGLGKFSQDTRYVEAGSTVLGRLNSGVLMAAVDKFTVDATFRVLMYDIMADGYEFGTDEFFKEFKQRLYAVYQSNPQYAEIYKTPLQAIPGIGTALAQFQTVMIEGYNNALQAKMALDYYKKMDKLQKSSGGGGSGKGPGGPGDVSGTDEAENKNIDYKKELKKARHRYWAMLKGLALGAGLLVVMKDLVKQAMGKAEDDKTFWERIALSYVQNLLSYTIIGDEIFSAIAQYNNYDLTTNELSYFNNMLDTIGYVAKAIGEGSPSDGIKALKGTLSMFGVPASGIEDMLGVIGNYTGSELWKAYSVLKNKNTYNSFLKHQEGIDGDIVTFYDMKQKVNDKTLESEYDWVKGSPSNSYNSKGNAKARAIKDVLGYPQNKPLNKQQQEEYNKWYTVFKNN